MKGAPRDPEKFPYILIGNKIDKEAERAVEVDAVTAFLARHPKILHLTTSAKNREGVEVAFEKIALASIADMREDMYTSTPIQGHTPLL